MTPPRVKMLPIVVIQFCKTFRLETSNGILASPSKETLCSCLRDLMT